MTHVATLICDPASPCLTDGLLARAAQAVHADVAARWLDPGVAADILVDGAAAAQAREKITAALSGLPVDVIVQPLARRRKKLLLADMDSTMIGQECIDELADFAGKKEQVAAITERAMRGEIAFEPALRERVALLKGLAAGIVDRVISERITLTPGARALVATMRAHGAYTALVSGGFTLFTGRVGGMIGFDEDRANHLDVADGAFAGTVREPILGKQAKLDTLTELCRARGLEKADTLCVGDGANDLAMLGEAGLGVAYHAKPAVAAAAHARVDHGDLTALLYMQWYRSREFAG